MFEEQTPAEVRDMAQPKLHGQPDTYLSPLWTTAAAAGDFHTLDGVPNHWFYLLAQGGSGTNDVGADYFVSGVGRTTAEEIALATLSRLGQYATLKDARTVSINAAEETFGPDSAEAKNTAAAWDAVGVVDPDAPTNDLIVPSYAAESVEAWPVHFEFISPNPLSPGQIQVSDDPTFKSNVHTYPVTAQKVSGNHITSIVEVILRPMTVYYWRNGVTSHNRVQWSPTAKFETSRMAPRNVLPKDGDASVDPFQTVLTWDEVYGATGYTVQMATNPELNQALQTRSPSEPHATFHLALNTKYYWRVRAVAPPTGGKGDWSTRYHSEGFPLESTRDLEQGWSKDIELSFTTDSAKVEFISPALDQAVPAWPVPFSWKKLPGAASYDLQVAEPANVDFSGALWLNAHLPGEDTISHPWDVPVEKGKFHWRVRAIGPNSEQGAWSNDGVFDNQAFTLSDDAFPACISPMGGVALDPKSVQLTFKPVTGALYYLASADSSMADHSEAAVDAPAASMLMGNLVPGREYHWTVIAAGPVTDPVRLFADAQCDPVTYRFITTAQPCNTVVTAGGALVDEQTFELGATSGTVKIHYKTYEVADAITVSYQGVPIWQTGCTTTPDPDQNNISLAPWVDSPPIPYSGTSTQMTVHVDPNCNPATASPTTEWMYHLDCPTLVAP